MDTIDCSIVEILSKNARTSVAEIARRVGLSAPSAAERVRRLEDAGVIRGYHADIDPEALGYAASAWLNIRPVPGKLHTVSGILPEIAEITQCERVTGEDCFLAKVHVARVRELEDVIDRIIPHAMTRTSVIQSTTVASRLPPLPGAGDRGRRRDPGAA